MIGFIFDDHAWNVAPENVRRFAEMGGRIARIPFRWEELETRDGFWSWGKMDAAVDAFRANGIRVFGILGNPPVTPRWIDRERFRTRDALPELGHWLDYVRKVVRRYRDDVKVWEIGNEPFTDVQQMVPFHQYATFLRLSYLEAKAIDPACTVLMGAIRHQDDLDQIRRFIVEPGAKDYTDGINFHTLYVGSRQPEDYGYERALVALEDFAVQNEMRTELHLTESAWASMNIDGQEDGRDYVSEPLQAAYSVRTVVIGLAHPMLRSMVNAWVVNDSPQAWWPESWWYWSDTGFIREDGSEKPAYHAMRFLHRVLSGASYAGRPAVAEPLQAFEFERADAWVRVYWTTGSRDPVTYVPRSPRQVPQFFDQLGELAPSSLEADGSYAFSVTRTPVYVVESKAPVSRYHDRAALTVTFNDGTTGPLRQFHGPAGAVGNGTLRLPGPSAASAPSAQFTVPGVLYGDALSLALGVRPGMPEDSHVGFLVRAARETASPWENGPQALVSLRRLQGSGRAAVVVARYDPGQGGIVTTFGPALATDPGRRPALFLVRVEQDRVRAWVNGELGIDLSGLATPARGGYCGLYGHVDPSSPGDITLDHLAIRAGDRSTDVSVERDGRVYVSVLQKNVVEGFVPSQFGYLEHPSSGGFTAYGSTAWLFWIASPIATWEAFESDFVIAEIDPVNDSAGLELGAWYGPRTFEAEILP
jgi:GH35 family endo-1,4-beta-xylanase